MSNATLTEYDQYTKSILGDRLTLILGRPVVSNPTQGAYSWKPPEGIVVQRKPTMLLRGVWSVLTILAIPASIYAGWTLFEATKPVDAVTLPVQQSGSPTNSTVRLSDQEYQPPPVMRPDGPLPMPIPLPVDGSGAAGLPAALRNLDARPVQPPAAPAPAAPAEKEKEKPSAVILDDGPKKAEEPKPQPAAQPKVQPPKASSAPSEKLPPPAAATPATKPAPTSPAAVAPVAKPPTDLAVGAKLAQPVEERGVGVVGPSGGAAGSAQPAKITVVDITPGGKKVLVTNPATRLPTALAVGDKLPNGKVIQSIDEKSGSITADGTTYKLD